MVAQRIADKFGRNVNNLNHAIVGHARWPDHAERTHNGAVHFVGAADDGQVLKRHHLALSSNKYPNTFCLAGDVHQSHKLRFLLKQFKRTAQVSHITGKIRHGQQVAFARNDDFVLHFRDRFRTHIHRCLHQRRDLGAQRLHLALQPLADILDVQPDVMAVQKVRCLHQLRL